VPVKVTPQNAATVTWRQLNKSISAKESGSTKYSTSSFVKTGCYYGKSTNKLFEENLKPDACVRLFYSITSIFANV